MARLRRLDAELVRRGLARSRRHASELVDSGRVTVAGLPALKPAAQHRDARLPPADRESRDPEALLLGRHSGCDAADRDRRLAMRTSARTPGAGAAGGRRARRRRAG